ncbi:MAG TPA: fumarylacetoacetate hydrolase family protein [Acidimicrobiales bacterium]|nr:fumarylacetoacetate hydrolase family protein [Acidimicrobiales bacterium]
MRAVSFLRGNQRGYGVVIGDVIADASAALGDRFTDLDSILHAGAFAELHEAGATAATLALEEVQLLPPIVGPRIFCIGINYRSHRDEMGRDASDHPTVFVRFPSSLVGHGAPLLRPLASDRFDYEGELAVVIGRPGRRIEREYALEHVAGYSCFNDGSIRDYQRHTSQFTAGKNFDRSGSFGPWLVTADEVGDPAALTLTTRLNGEVMQHSTTDLLIFDVPEIIAYLSEFTELHPGDIIATGTPGGVGAARDPAVFMRPGDTIEVEISDVGLLCNEIVQE